MATRNTSPEKVQVTNLAFCRVGRFCPMGTINQKYRSSNCLNIQSADLQCEWKCHTWSHAPQWGLYLNTSTFSLLLSREEKRHFHHRCDFFLALWPKNSQDRLSCLWCEQFGRTCIYAAPCSEQLCLHLWFLSSRVGHCYFLSPLRLRFYSNKRSTSTQNSYKEMWGGGHSSEVRVACGLIWTHNTIKIGKPC